MGKLRFKKNRTAFALVSSLLLAATLILLAIAAAAHLAIETVRSARELDRARARLIAHAGMRIALGEMQTAVGPDRRTTAEAAILGETGAAHPHWAGVWRSDRLNTEPPDAPPFVHRDPATGALKDRRRDDTPYDAKREVLRWLVSGGDDPPENLSGRMRPGNRLRLVGPDEADTPVFAPAVSAGDGTRFAWWAGDEGVKARYNLPDLPEPGEKLERPSRLSPPPRVGTSLFPGWRPVTPAAPATGTDGDATLLGDQDDASRRSRFHDITPFSAGVLANQRDGGLRRDLTPYLLSTGSVAAYADAPGMDDDTPLLAGANSPFVRFPPRAGILRRWAKLGAEADSGTVAPATGARRVQPVFPAPADTFHDGTHANLPDTAAWNSPVVAPVLTEAAVYHRIGYDSKKLRDDGAPRLRLHLHPRVTLWNPYDATLAPARYLVHLRANGSPEFRLVKTDKVVIGRLTGWRVYRDKEVNYATTQGSLLFLIDCPEIPAGESRLFLPKTTGEFDIQNPNKLEVATALTNANLYLEDAAGFEAAGLKALAGISVAGESWLLKNSAAEDHAAALKLIPSAAAPTDWASLRLYPTVRYISCSHKCGVGTTADPAWPAGVTQPLLDDMNAGPAPRTRDGVRLRRLEETAGNLAAFAPAAHMDIAPFANHNPLAVFSCRNPLDNATPQEPGGSSGIRRPEYFGAFTRDAFDEAADWPALAPAGPVTAVPIGAPAAFPALKSLVASPLPPAPERLAALADFSFAPVSPWAWQPLRTTGESRVEPDIPAGATAYGPEIENWADMGVGAKHYLDWTRRTESPREPLVYDARFEMNHALFDNFCLISGGKDSRKDFVDTRGAKTLPNTRVRLAPGARDAGEKLTGEHAFHRGAAAVTMAGAFNINSVSETAWSAVLASTLGRAPDGAPAPGAGASFPRSPRAPADVAAQDAGFRDPKFWNNARALSPEEIERLARELVVEIKLRGPFTSLSDFVNRRLEPGAVSCDPKAPTPNACGALQAAIDRSGVNAEPEAMKISRFSALPGTRHEPDRQAWLKTEGAAARLSQADILRALGPVMAARSDTFRLRVCAETCDGASVTLEAIVQRLPSPVMAHSAQPDGASRPNPDEPSEKTAGLFGRRLVIVRLREVR